MAVQLVSLFPSGEALTIAATTTGTEGAFRFEGLNTEVSLLYQVRAAFHDGDFRGQAFSFTPGESRLAADLPVFDTTADPGAVRFTSVLTLVELDGRRLLVTQPIKVLNTTDSAYIGPAPQDGESRRTLVIPLPAGVKTVQYLEGLLPEDAELTAAGVFFRVPLAPGPRNMLLRYEVPVAAARYRLTWRSEFATDQFDILLLGLRVESGPSSLKDEGVITVEGREFRRLVARGVAPGAALQATLVGLPVFDVQQALRWAALGVGLSLGTALLAMAILKGMRPPTAEALAAERERLLVEVGGLDERLEAGQIRPDAYSRRRRRRLARLLALDQALEAREDPRGAHEA
ncbi:MAG: hypothetical protein EXR60_03795 [Dehalococcoidia bacterium]|nr:hypothetical protein [Dehalococcoidia bacterium]